MSSYRQDRVNAEMMRVLSEVIRDVKDYRVAGSLLSITRVNVSQDLMNATVLFSVMGSEYSPRDVRKGLMSAQGFIRSQVARIMNLRQTPAFSFVYDDSMEQGAQINSLLKKVEAELAVAEERDRRLAEAEGQTEDTGDEADE